MDMRRGLLAAIGLAATAASMNSASAQQQDYIDKDGIRYQVIQQHTPTQVPVTEMRSQEQTTYRQQITTENVQHQQVYHVPVTQYQAVQELHNRWNPFAAPYYTVRYEPVTTWQQQVGTVQIPVNKVTMVPETRTVQQPITTWKTVNNTTTYHRAIGPTPTGLGANTMMAAAQPLNNAPTASLTPVTSTPTQVAANPYGGQKITNEQPRYPTAPANTNSVWQQQPATSAPQTQTATQPTAPAQTQSRY